MSSENGDRAALHKDRLIASMVALGGRHSSEESEPWPAYSRERERFDVDRTTPNVNSPGVNGTPVKVNDLDVDKNQTNWTPPRNDFLHYQISLLRCLGPFSGAYPLLQTTNLSPVCVTAQVPHPFRQIAHTLKDPILSDGFGTTPLQGRTSLPLIHDPYLHASCASVLAKWIPEKIPPNHFQRNSLNVFQTFSRA